MAFKYTSHSDLGPSPGPRSRDDHPAWSIPHSNGCFRASGKVRTIRSGASTMDTLRTKHDSTYSPSPPHPALDSEVVSMITPRARGSRILPWTLAAILMAFFVGAPRGAAARRHLPIPIPVPDGDPTADDQPSPAPKQGRNYAERVRLEGRNDFGQAAWSKGRLIWLSYVRTWIRISTR